MIFRLAVAAFVLACGLTVRGFAGGAFAKYAGVAFYAVFVYALIWLFAPRVRPWLAGAAAWAWCWAVEFGQLTGIPAQLAQRVPLIDLVLGTTFHLPDLFWYVVGVVLAAGVHGVARRVCGGSCLRDRPASA